MPGKKPLTPAEKAAMARRDKAMSGTGISRLTRTLRAPASQKAQIASGAKNSKGIQTATAEEAKRVRHRLELKYPKTYKGGGKR
jgi:alpha-D-ribose 1-methylphosphonate 5-triphosphate diphosphatase PhnM